MRLHLAFLPLLLIAAFGAAGCRDYQAQTADARAAYYSGDFGRAGDLYRKQSHDQDRDRLLYFLDAGMAFHSARQYEESNRFFLRADEVIEDLNFTHAGAQTLAVITDDRALPYVGEEFEDVLVNVFAALNYLMSGDRRGPEEALVECRRLDWKLREFAERQNRKYLQNAFARYISGVAYEMDREPNDAYIDYKAVHALRPDFEPVKRDLVRLARRLNFNDEAADWEKKFNIRHDRDSEAGTGEVVLVYQCGRAPVKTQHEKLLDLPVYAKVPFQERGAEVSALGRPLGRTQVLEDVEATAIKTLSDRMGPIIARRTANLALRTGAAVAVHQAVKKSSKDSGLADAAGFLAFELLTAATKADTRSWLTLPANLQVARLRLPAGTHTIGVQFLDAAGQPTAHRADFSNVPVSAGRITVLTVRSLN